MHILNVYRTYFPDPPGGLQEAIRQICSATNQLGAQNTILTLSPQPLPAKITYPEANVIRLKSWAAPASCDIGGLNAITTFKTMTKNHDLIHYFYPWPFADLLNQLVNPNKPIITTYISDIVRQQMLGKLYAKLMWKNLMQMDAIVANCPAYIESSPVLSHPNIRDKVKIIPLGIDENTYPKLGDDTILNTYHLHDKPYFLFLGVFRYYKGLHTLIAAAKSVNATIVIAGSGPEEANLKKQAAALNCTNIVFTGRVSDAEKKSLLQNCLAFVLPSHLRSEAFGMVLVEAAMHAKPMISCEINTGTSYVNKHEETGLTIAPENTAQLVDAMHILLTNAAFTKKMGENARIRYEALFSGPALGLAYATLYKSLI